MSEIMTNYEELLEKEEQTLQTAREIQRLLNDVNSGYSQALDALGSLKGEIEGKLEDFNNKKQTLEQNMVSSSEALKLFYQKVDEITPKIEEIKTIYARIGETKGEIDTIYESMLQIEQSVKETKKLIDKAAEALDLPSFIEEATAKRDEILSGLTNGINTLLEQQKAIYRDILNQLNSAAENAIDEISNAGVQMNSIKDGAIEAVNEAKSNASSEITSLKGTSLQAIQELKDQSTQAIEQQKNSSVQAVEDAEEHAIMEINKLVPTEPELIDAYTLKTVLPHNLDYFSEIKHQVRVNKFWEPEEFGNFFIKIPSSKVSYFQWGPRTADTLFSFGSGEFFSASYTTFLRKEGDRVYYQYKTTTSYRDYPSGIKKLVAGISISFILLNNGDLYAIGMINNVVNSTPTLVKTGVYDVVSSLASGSYYYIFQETGVGFFNDNDGVYRDVNQDFGRNPVGMSSLLTNPFIIKTEDGRLYSVSGTSAKSITGFKSVGIGFAGSISIEMPSGNIGVCSTSGLWDTGMQFVSHKETYWGFQIVDGKLRGNNNYIPSSTTKFSIFNDDNVIDILFGYRTIGIIKKPITPIGEAKTTTF